MEKRVWWQKPTLRTDEEFNKDRAVTWLELFFDLVFVVVFEKLAHSLSADFSFMGVIQFALLFFAVFWVWNSAVYYVERFESEGMEIRFFTFCSMVSVTGLAIYSHHGLTDNYRGFIGAYLLARIINITMWVRSGVYVKEFMPIAIRFLIGFSLTSFILVASLYAPQKLYPLFFGVAIIVDIIAPYFTMEQQAKLPKLSSSKFPERFGLLTIIVLGATIVEVIGVLSETHHLNRMLMIKGGFALYIIFSLWAIYFDFIARRSPKEQIRMALFWVYLHLLLLLGITIVGIPLGGLIREAAAGGVTALHEVSLLFSLGFSLVIMAILELTLKDDEKTHSVISPLIKAGVGIMLTFLTVFPFHNSIMVLALCAVGVTVPNMYGLKVLFVRKREELSH